MSDRYEMKPADCPLELVPPGSELGEHDPLDEDSHGLVIGDPSFAACVIVGSREALKDFAHRVELLASLDASTGDEGELGGQEISRADASQVADGTEGTYRALTYEEFPHQGHMLVISAEWDAVYWLADRHTVIRGGAVELEGPGQRLLEVRADDRGLVTFRHVREHDVAGVAAGTPAARAVAQLTDPGRIEETLYPPYVSDSKARSSRPYLRPPEGLIYRNSVVLDRQRRVIYWLWDMPDHYKVFEASLGGYGPVYWDSAHESTSYPAWVLPALIHDSRS